MIRADHHGPHRTIYNRNKKIILATQTMCALCGKEVDKSLKYPNPMSASVDHIIPISKKNDIEASDLDNLQLMHLACNRAKGTKIIAPKDTKPNKELPLSMDWARYRA